MIDNLLPWLGPLGLILGAVLAWMTAGRKAGVDESGIVFTQWKELMDRHKDDMKILKDEFNLYKTAANTEIQGLRDRLNTVENDFATFRRKSDDRTRLLEDENQGLRKQITQVGKAAHAEVQRAVKQFDAKT